MRKTNEEKEYSVVVYKDTSTTKIIDVFSEFDENNERVYDLLRLRFDRKCFCMGEGKYDIEFLISRCTNEESIDNGLENGITFSEMKKGDYFCFEYYIKEQFHSAKEMLDKVGLDKDYYFDTCFLFRAQSSYQHGKGSTAGGYINYGSTNSYVIKGIKIMLPYSILFSKGRIDYIKLFD